MGNWKKRLLAMVLAVCMVAALVPTAVFAAGTVASGTCGENLTWVLDDAGTLTISGTGEMKDSFYPGEDCWESYLDAIRTIVLEPGVTNIGYSAFERCVNLTSVTIPEGVTEIRNHAFGGCASLKEITFPESLTSVCFDAFYGCTSLTSVVFPYNVEKIDFAVFSGCTNLQYVAVVRPDCWIGDEADTLGVPGTTVVLGFPGSTAHQYATKNGYDFVSIGFEDVYVDAYYFVPVLWAEVYGITAGTDETHFSPKMACSRAQTVTFLWRAAGCPEPTGSKNPFPDVSANSYYAKAVQWAYENGIVSGRGNGKFCPNDTVTRAEFVTFLWRAVGEPTPDDWNPFVDVPAGKFYTDAVLWAAQYGITAGVDDTHFAPNSPCTRAQVVTFLFRLLAE